MNEQFTNVRFESVSHKKMINEINAPRYLAPLNATSTTLFSPIPYRADSYASPTKDFTVEMD